MSVLGRLMIFGGGLAVGLIAAGMKADADKRRLKSGMRGYRTKRKISERRMKHGVWKPVKIGD